MLNTIRKKSDSCICQYNADAACPGACESASAAVPAFLFTFLLTAWPFLNTTCVLSDCCLMLYISGRIKALTVICFALSACGLHHCPAALSLPPPLWLPLCLFPSSPLPLFFTSSSSSGSALPGRSSRRVHFERINTVPIKGQRAARRSVRKHYSLSRTLLRYSGISVRTQKLSESKTLVNANA